MGAMAQAKEFTIDAIIKDFEVVKPSLVVVDTNENAGGIFKDFDFVAYFKQNALFRAQWSHYREVQTITVDGKDAGREGGRYTVYSRIAGNKE